jgi:histidinol-phosphate/aromatic aminotransferase/cobyric acid decarboxylase-like protein
MNWKPPWTKNDPVSQRAQALAEAEAALARELAEIHAQMEALKNPVPPIPPGSGVSNHQSTNSLEDEDYLSPSSKPKLVTERTLRAQQKQDRNLFILLLFFLVVLLIWLIRAL